MPNKKGLYSVEEILADVASVKQRSKNLGMIREVAEFLDELAGDDPAKVVGLAKRALVLAATIGPCSRSEIYGVRGSANRKLELYKDAESDFLAALSECSCQNCFPRIRRREAFLLAC